MTALLLALALPSALRAAPEPVWKPGDRIEAQVEIRMTNRQQDIDLVEIEAWTLEIPELPKSPPVKTPPVKTPGGKKAPEKEPVDDAVQMRLTRALLETRFNGATAGPPADVPQPQPWTFRPDGSLGFRPNARTMLEGRLFRLIGALLPYNGGDPAGRESIEFPDERAENLPPAVFRRDLRRRAGPLRAVDVTYREEGVRMGGLVTIDPQNGWPLFWTLRINGLTLEGGEFPVDTVVILTATKAKIRGQNVGLPEKDAKRPG